MDSHEHAFQRSFLTELSTAGRKLRTLFDGLVRQRGLTLARARALLHLSRSRGMSQTELASLMDVEGPTIVRLLDGMEKNGLVARSASDGDRRVKQITLPPTARRQVEEIEEIASQIEQGVLRGIDPAEVEVAIRVLRQMIRNMEPAS
jgi:MarR family transcriptional regulator for hemolysin